VHVEVWCGVVWRGGVVSSASSGSKWVQAQIASLSYLALNASEEWRGGEGRGGEGGGGYRRGGEGRGGAEGRGGRVG
jgi:hypothetical protein